MSRRGANTRGRTLGRVNDLSQHVHQDWWRDLFGALYLETDGDVVENDEATRAEVELLIRASGVDPTSRILDLCCGQGRHAIELARRGFKHVTGVDYSRYLLRLARTRSRRDQLAVRFRQGDARDVALPKASFNCVALLGSSLGYFEAEDDDVRVLETARNTLRSFGVLALDVADGAWMAAHHEPRSWEWIDGERLVCRERQLAKDATRLYCREIVLHTKRGVMADQFYAVRLYDRQRLLDLLNRVGFLDVEIAEEVAGQSTRDEDLGMMQSRMFVIAHAPKSETLNAQFAVAKSHHANCAATTKGKDALEVLVVLGDPRRPDPVKRGGRFNDEDLEVIERVRSALATLDRYRFAYVDDHDSLVRTLGNHKPDLVFNLCDEGYGNERAWELHVPALLDVFGLPYTGAGPASLALCARKHDVRAIAHSLGISVPDELHVTRVPSNPIDLTFPILVKPTAADGSFGIQRTSLVHTWSELVAQLRAVPRFANEGALLQQWLPGREYSVALLSREGEVRPLPLLEVNYEALPASLPRLLPDEAKWDPKSAYWKDVRYIPAELVRSKEASLVNWSCRLFDRLGCRDYARFDFREDEHGEPRLLDVNPNPGWCWDGKMNLMAAWGGLSYPELLGSILDAARARLNGAPR